MPVLDPNLLLSIKDGADWEASNDPLVYEKQVIYCDTFKKWDQRTGKLLWEMTVTEPIIDDWVAQFSEFKEEGVAVPLPVGHEFSPEAKRGDVIGLVKKLDKKGRVSLYAQIKFLNLKYANDYKHSNVSLYAPPMHKHQNKTWIRPITHVAITDYPVIGDLEGFTIAASNELDTPNMDYLVKLCELMEIEVPEGATEDDLVTAISDAWTAMQDELSALQEGAGDNKPKPDEKPVLDASNVRLLSLERDNRKMKIDALLNGKQARITPAQAKKMTEKFVTGYTGAEEDGFAAAYDLALSNEPLSITQERSGGQKTGGGVHSTSKLVEDAKRRREQAKK